MELISVIIPVYNTGAYLRPCIESILHQSYHNLELLLIDDGSDDDSFALCQAYAAKDRRVQAIHKENGGVSSARNAGIRLAHGEWFSFIDSDDYLEPDAYEYLLGLAQTYGCDAVDFEYYITKNGANTQHRLPQQQSGLLDRRQSMHLLHGGAPFTVTKLFHRKIVEGIWFDETIARGEDGLFNTMVLHRAERVYYTDRPFYHYVQSEESAVRGEFRPSQLTAIKLLDFYVPFFSENYPELLGTWYQMMGHLLISLYYEMAMDAKNYCPEQAHVRSVYHKLYPKILAARPSKKVWAKFSIFRYAPWLYCIMHKTD